MGFLTPSHAPDPVDLGGGGSIRELGAVFETASCPGRGHRGAGGHASCPGRDAADEEPDVLGGGPSRRIPFCRRYGGLSALRLAPDAGKRWVSQSAMRSVEGRDGRRAVVGVRDTIPVFCFLVSCLWFLFFSS